MTISGFRSQHGWDRDAVTTTYTYEPRFGQLASVTDLLNHTWAVGLRAGQTASTTDPLSHQTVYGTDGAGRVTSMTDPLQHTVQLGYTGGDLVSVTNALGQSTTRFPDAAGRVMRTVDPLGRPTVYSYDALNRLTTLTDALGEQTLFSYDPNSRLLSLTDAQTQATSYTYDASDRAATRTDPLQQTQTYAYDGNDHLTQAIDRKGQLTTYEYDALDRLTLVTYADASTTQYVYDAGDRLTQVIDSTAGTITRGYDGLDRLISETTPEGTVSYTYDDGDRRETMTVAGQPIVTYGYDNANRLTSITQGASVVAITYDDADRRSTLTLPNGIVTTYGYDAADRLTSLTYTHGANTLGTLTYAYDAAGQRTLVGGTWARTGLPAAVASATYDAANRVMTWGGTTFSYDANGNLGSDGLTSYLWNARDQLAGLSGGVTASFQYDGLLRRRAKTVSGTTTGFVYDGLNPVQERTGGSPSANLIAGLDLDEVFTRTDSGGSRHVLADVLSSVGLADGAGAVQTQYSYEPFGKTTASGGASGNPSRFTGREDDGSGLYYYRARYQHPTLQRFVSEDPLDFAGGDTNLYAYVGNDPTNFTDATGEIAPWAAACLSGAAWDAGWYAATHGRKSTWGGAATAAARGCGAGLVGFGLGKALGAAARASTRAGRGREPFSPGKPGKQTGLLREASHIVTKKDRVDPEATDQTANRFVTTTNPTRALSMTTLTNGEMAFVSIQGDHTRPGPGDNHMLVSAAPADVVESTLLAVLTDPTTHAVTINFRMREHRFSLHASGVDGMLVNQLLDQNIVDEAKVYGRESDPGEIRDLLARVLFHRDHSLEVTEPTLVSRLQENIAAILEGRKACLEIVPVYGASVLLLATSFEWRDSK